MTLFVQYTLRLRLISNGASLAANSVGQREVRYE